MRRYAILLWPTVAQFLAVCAQREDGCRCCCCASDDINEYWLHPQATTATTTATHVTSLTTSEMESHTCIIQKVRCSLVALTRPIQVRLRSGHTHKMPQKRAQRNCSNGIYEKMPPSFPALCVNVFVSVYVYEHLFGCPVCIRVLRLCTH